LASQPVISHARSTPAAVGKRLTTREVGAGEPPHVLELVVADARLAADGTRFEAEHQRRRKRPRLAAAIDDIGNL